MRVSSAFLSLTLLLALSACGSRWDMVDHDGDGYSVLDGDCWDRVEGPEGSGLSGADIHPGAVEVWYDGIDQDCRGDDDFDVDQDGWVPAMYEGLPTLGVPTSGSLPGGDCWDDPLDPDAPEVVPGHLTDKDGTQLNWEPLTAADVNPTRLDTWYDGVDQDCKGNDDFDRDGDGYRSHAYPDHRGVYGDDCIDGNNLDEDNFAGSLPRDVNPGADEIWYDGTDQDCDGNDCDADGDGYDYDGLGLGYCEMEECDDTNPDIYPDPSIEEIWYNGVDENCNGNDGDQDGDGFWVDDYDERVAANGGTPLPIPSGKDGDCLDTDPAVYPGATEIWYDGIDQNCDGWSDYDADLDGYDSDVYGGDDCDDTNASINPGAPEIWYDGIDQNCDGWSDYDADMDGYDSDAYGGADCDDTNPSIHPGATEIWYDGVDQDCDGRSDYDADMDGYDSDAYGGADCDDTDASIKPGATEIWYDGVDQDCDGWSDYDADMDGYDCEIHSPTGDDCDDTDSGINPGVVDDASDHLVDNNCDGFVDESAISAGSIIFNEINKRSSAGGDAGYTLHPPSNWVEIYNTESFDIDVSNWVLSSCTRNTSWPGGTHSWSNCDDEYEVAISPDAALVIPAGGYLVLCQDEDTSIWNVPAWANCSYAYTDTATWTGTSVEGYPFADEDMSITDGYGIVALSIQGTTVDEVGWRHPQWPLNWHYSMCLMSGYQDHEVNDSEDSWSSGSYDTSTIWATDPANNFGTPGAENTNCP